MVLLIDGSNLIHRILHTEQINTKNSMGISTGGIYGFLRSLNKLCRRFNYDYLPVVCWDEGTVNFRSKIYPEYKNWKVAKSRDDIPQVEVPEEEEEFLVTLAYSKQYLHTSILPLLNVPSVMTYGVEADDIIAHITFTTTLPCVIVSNDDDLVQLISKPSISLLKPSKDKVLHQEEILSEYDLSADHFPQQFILEKAITGDISDGVPGVYGLGPKYASKISKIVYGITPEVFSLDVGFHKKYLEGKEIIDRNIQLMDLRYFFDHATEERERVRNRVLNALVYSHDNAQIADAKLRQLEITNASDLVLNIMQSGESSNARALLVGEFL